MSSPTTKCERLLKILNCKDKNKITGYTALPHKIQMHISKLSHQISPPLMVKPLKAMISVFVDSGQLNPQRMYSISCDQEVLVIQFFHFYIPCGLLDVAQDHQLCWVYLNFRPALTFTTIINSAKPADTIGKLEKVLTTFTANEKTKNFVLALKVTEFGCLH